MSLTVDLKQLAVRRDAPPAPAQRHLLIRYVLPGVVLLGFVGVAGWAARDSLLASRPVTVVPVLTTRAELQQEGTPLFQAAGWVEPRPTPVMVSALAEGVIAQLLVVEGQAVKQGEPVAQLIDEDARLAVEAAVAELRQREAEADALIAKADNDAQYLPFQLQSAQAALRLARIDHEGKKGGIASVPAILLHKAEAELTTMTTKVEELTARKQQLEREVASLRRMRDAFRKREEDKLVETSTEAEAAMRTALTRIRQGQVAVEAARLRLERMTVRAPSTGRVLALIARPGMRLMGLSPNSMHDASTIITMYDPAQLQVRADVLFENLPRVLPGQPVRIECPAINGCAEGEVLFSTSQADIQKNTLQVKVALKAPPPVLKPDMLVQATFLAVKKHEHGASSDQLRLLLPRPVVESGDGGVFVWLADQANRVARRRPVKLGGTVGELVEVVEGLNAADKIISGDRAGLSDGARITITGEDATLGVPAQGAATGKSGPQRLTTGHEGKH